MGGVFGIFPKILTLLMGHVRAIKYCHNIRWRFGVSNIIERVQLLLRIYF
jgi:hypothetical protein